MQNESWLVKKDRVWAMRFLKDKHPDEDGTTYIRVHYASCRLRFLHGITPHVQLHESEKLTYEKARDLWRSSVETEWEVSKKPLWETSESFFNELDEFSFSFISSKKDLEI